MAEDLKSEGLPDGLQPDDPAAEHALRVQQLFLKNLSGIKAFILSLHPDFTEAEDILQEVFLVVTRKAGDFLEGSNFMAWVLTIARFKVLESLRRRKVDVQSLSEKVIETLCEEAPEPGFFETRLAAVRACLETLAPRMREVIRLRYFAERGCGEIARELSWTPNSVNVALSRARKLMYKCVMRRLREG